MYKGYKPIYISAKTILHLALERIYHIGKYKETLYWKKKARHLTAEPTKNKEECYEKQFSYTTGGKYVQ